MKKRKSTSMRQINFQVKPDDYSILASLARHYDCSMTKVLVQMIRKTGKPRGRPRILTVKVGKIA